ncbi:MAG: tetratricopeptide repeat protein, partial [Dongia sp.]
SDSTIRNMAPGKDEDTARAYEDAFWDSVKDSTVAEDVRAYLNKYPRGRYAGQAQQKLKALGKDSQPAVMASVQPPAQAAPPLPPFQTVDQQIYARDRVRLRATPDKNGEVLGRVAANAALKATGKSADGAWWRVTMDNGGTAYVAGSVVSDQPPAPAPEPAPASVAAAPTAPSAAPAQDASAAGSSAPTTPPSGKDEDICPSDSNAAPADRIAACRRMLANATDSASKNTALIELGNNFYDMGQRDEALKNYQAAIDADPRVAASYANIGLVRLDQYRFDEARAAFDKAFQLDPDNADDIYQRGVALGDLGSFDAALSDVKRAIEMKSDVSDYYGQLGLLQLADGSIEDAVAATDKAVSLSDAFWSGTAVIAYYLGENYPKSIEMIDKGAKEQPDYPYWPIWRAMSQSASGDKSAAQQTLADGLRKVGAKWPAPLMRFMTGEISESKLRELANMGDQRTRSERLCELEFYRGEMAYQAGDKVTAKAAMNAAAGARIYYYLEDAAARARLAQLD